MTETRSLIAAAVERDRARRRTRITESLVWHAVSLAMTFGAGWAFMVGVGVAHHNWLPTTPTVDYGTSVLLSALAVAATRAVRLAVVPIRSGGSS
jgi:hypothetical protein